MNELDESFSTYVKIAIQAAENSLTITSHRYNSLKSEISKNNKLKDMTIEDEEIAISAIESKLFIDF